MALVCAGLLLDQPTYAAPAALRIAATDSSGFSNVTASVAPGLPGVGGSSVAWGDYDRL